ncbi:MAG TPA: adenylate/guanylate cyclase domain-containing protein [Anaerolineales bacterium]|nr:adenylate/guanylate cyclase domain-containing protein [Anaerolineales bacterium]
MNEPGGELRYMTVVFADLAGFTSFAEDRSPDEVAQIVGELLQRLAKVVEEHNGGVDKYLGDAVVATFGLPKPDPNAARNAVRAGLAMQEEAAAFNREYGFNFGLRVGIHAGQAMFRAIGGSWTVMGDTVNTASRIQSSAAPGKVWISQPVYEEVRRFFDLTVRPAIELKGKKHTVQPFEVRSERKVPMVDLPPFVGRETEWRLIQSTLREAVQQKTLKALFVHGAAGVGKSRLVWELREWVRRSPELYRVDVIHYDHSARLPSHGLNAVIRSRFQLPLELSEEAILERLTKNIVTEHPSAQDGRGLLAVEFFAFVLGIMRPDFQIQSMDGLAKWQNAFLEIKSWIEFHAAQEPWILVFEDVQKGDADTAAFLDWALKMEWHAPVFVMVIAREEDFASDDYWYEPLARWTQNGQMEELRLREIEPHTLAQALSHLGGAINETLALRIAEHTEGNPLFAIELALLLKEQGIEYSAVENLPLPGSIREVMEARLERLGLAGKEVAKRGALMGRRFTLEAVGRIWEHSQPEMQNGLRVLRETETIYQEASKLFVGEMEEVFRHGRLQEAALARIPKDERQRWLSGLEIWAKSKLESFGEYWEGVGIMLIPLIIRARKEHGDTAEVSLWYETLAWLHRRHHRHQEAADAFREALLFAKDVRRLVLYRLAADLDLISGAVERAREMMQTAFAENLGSAELPAMPERIQSLIDDPLAHWDRITLPEAALALKLMYADALVRLGQPEPARQLFMEAEQELANLSGPTADILSLRWANRWGYLLSEMMANPQSAEQLYARVRSALDLEAPHLQGERSKFLDTEFNIEMRLGRYNRALVLAEELLQIARREGNLREEARAHNSLGITLNALGDWDDAADSYERCLSLARSIGERRSEAISLHNLGIIRMDQARYDEARACQENYLTLSLATGNHLAESYAPAYLAVIAICQGQFDHAASLITRSLELARKNGWMRLVGLNQGITGLLDLHRWLASRGTTSTSLSASSCLPRVIETLSASEEIWKNVDEAGEFYAALVIAQLHTGSESAARATLERARTNVDSSWTAARIFLELSEAILERKPLDPFIAWFREHGFLRAVEFTEKIAAI